MDYPSTAAEPQQHVPYVLDAVPAKCWHSADGRLMDIPAGRDLEASWLVPYYQREFRQQLTPSTARRWLDGLDVLFREGHARE